MSQLPNLVLFGNKSKTSQVNGWGYRTNKNLQLNFIPHRLDGPAIERLTINDFTSRIQSVRREYWIHGMLVPPVEFEEQYLITHLEDYEKFDPFVYAKNQYIFSKSYDTCSWRHHDFESKPFGCYPDSVYNLKDF